MKMTKFYHYTPAFRIPEMLESEEIKPAVIGLGKNEKPVTWISSNPFWENTATKMMNTEKGLIQLTFNQQVQYFGCARIEVKPNNLIPWKSLKHQAKIDKKKAAFLVENGKIMGGKPEEWHGSLSPINISDWIKIEIYENGKWV